MERASPLRIDGSPSATPYADQDDIRLMRSARSDPRAFGVLYQRHVPDVYRYLRALVGNEDDAADLTQVAFLKALDALPRYKPRGTSVRPWLIKIAHNAAVDASRRERRTITIELLPEMFATAPGSDPEAEAIRNEDLGRLSRVLNQLSADKLELLALRFAAGLTNREIAQLRGRSEAAVKKQIFRIIHAVKEQYHDSSC